MVNMADPISEFMEGQKKFMDGLLKFPQEAAENFVKSVNSMQSGMEYPMKRLFDAPAEAFKNFTAALPPPPMPPLPEEMKKFLPPPPWEVFAPKPAEAPAASGTPTGAPTGTAPAATPAAIQSFAAVQSVPNIVDLSGIQEAMGEVVGPTITIRGGA